MHKIIVIADVNSFQKEVSFQRIVFLETLQMLGTIQLYHPTERVSIEPTDIIIFYFIRPFHHDSCFEIPSSFRPHALQSLIYMEDIYHVRDITRLLHKNKIFNLILPMRQYYYEQIFQRLGFRTFVVHTFLRVPRNVMIEEKTHDILLYGNTNPLIYPFRHRLFQLLLKHRHFFRIQHVPFLQISRNTTLEKQDILYRSIRGARLCVATNSVYNFLIKKYLEIPSCGTAILGNIPSNYSDIFTEDTIVYVHRNMSDHEIIREISNHLQNPERLQLKTDTLQKIIRSQFSLQNSLYEIEQIKKNFT